MEDIEDIRKEVDDINLDEEIVHEGLINGAKEIEPLDKTELKEMSKYIFK